MGDDSRRLERLVEQRTEELSEANRTLRETRRRLAHLNAVLRAVRNVNQLIVREDDPQRLIEGTCEQLIETRGYYGAWIALFGENGGLVGVAQAGLGEAFAPVAEALERGEMMRCGREALERRSVVAVGDVVARCGDCPLVERREGRGALAVRLAHGERVYGLLCASILADLADDAEEQALFRELADDLGLALHALQAEAERTRAEEALRETAHDLGERVKELDCLYAIARFKEESGAAVEELMQHVAEIIPSSWQYPEITCARIVLEGREYRSVDFREAIWKQSSDLVLDGERVGAVEVHYSEERPGRDEGPFLSEERDLIEAIAGELGRYLLRVRAEEALRDSEQRFRRFFEGAPVYCYMVSPEGRVLDVNDAALEALGYRKEELVGEPLTELYASEEEVRLSQLFERWKRTGRLRDEEMVIVTSSGERRTILLSADAVTDRDGRILHSISVQRDITDRKRAEKALRESERGFREMADMLPDMVYETDAELRFTYANQATFEALGYTQDNIDAGMAISDVVSGDDLPGAMEQLRAMAETDEGSVGVYSIERKDGSLIPCEIHSAAVRGPDGRLLGFRGVLRDITDRQRAQEAQRLEAVGQLALGVAHEFNNILAAMMGRAYLAEAGGSSKQWGELIHAVMEGGERGARICDSLLRFGRPQEPQREPTLIEGPIDAALAMAARQLENAEVDATRRYDTAGMRTDIDPAQLEQVFLNLIINACHAMPDGGRLAVETGYAPQEGGPGEITVTVSDTGTGVAPEDLPRIFDPFFSTKGAYGASGVPGTGLGLSVSRSIINAHEGTLTARSEVGVGTTFELRLPACEESPGKSQRVAVEREPRSEDVAGRAVLLVEDEREVREVLAEALSAEGYEVATASTTHEAINALRSRSFDAVVSDLLIPGGGGREVLAAAGELPVPPPVAFITGALEATVADKLLAAGAKACLQKPFQVPDLLAVISELIDQAPTEQRPADETDD